MRPVRKLLVGEHMSLSLWLLPASEDALRLQSVIERCAGATNSPRFPAHITLCTDVPMLNSSELPATLELPIRLRLSEPAFGRDYTHGCYVALSDGEALRDLQARCAARLGARVPGGYPLHVSLAYGLLDVSRQQRVRDLELPALQEVTFDRLELWHTEGPVSTWRRSTRRSSQLRSGTHLRPDAGPVKAAPKIADLTPRQSGSR